MSERTCAHVSCTTEKARHHDGEPGSTAGRHMLDVLRHQGLQGVLATVCARVVILRFAWPEAQAPALMLRLSDRGHGLLVWLDADNPSHD